MMTRRKIMLGALIAAFASVAIGAFIWTSDEAGLAGLGKDAAEPVVPCSSCDARHKNLEARRKAITALKESLD